MGQYFNSNLRLSLLFQVKFDYKFRKSFHVEYTFLFCLRQCIERIELIATTGVTQLRVRGHLPQHAFNWGKFHGEGKDNNGRPSLKIRKFQLVT